MSEPIASLGVFCSLRKNGNSRVQNKWLGDVKASYVRQLRRDDCLLDAFEIPHGNLNRRILELEIFGSLNGKNSIVIARALPLSLLKTPNRSENLEIFATSPYRRGHDHDSFGPRFPAFLPCS